MKTLIAYYSYTGDTAGLARGLAEKRGCDLLEVKDAATRPGKFKAYISGGLAAFKGKSWEIQPLELDLCEYEHIIIMAPVWAYKPAPQINSLIELLPGGKSVEIIMISASGKSRCKQKLEDKLSAKGCTMQSFRDVNSKKIVQLD